MNVVGELLELVGLLRRHPDEALGHRLGVLDAAGLDEVPAQQRVGGRPAHARAGAALVADLPPRSRRSFDFGIAAGAASRPAASACSNCQSFSVSRDGTTLRMRLTRLGLGLALGRLAVGMPRPYGWALVDVNCGWVRGRESRPWRLSLGMRGKSATDPRSPLSRRAARRRRTSAADAIWASTRRRDRQPPRGGTVASLHRGVYAVGHTVLTKEGRWMAATLATGGVLSHATAAAAWELLPRRRRRST